MIKKILLILFVMISLAISVNALEIWNQFDQTGDATAGDNNGGNDFTFLSLINGSFGTGSATNISLNISCHSAGSVFNGTLCKRLKNDQDFDCDNSTRINITLDDAVGFDCPSGSVISDNQIFDFNTDDDYILSMQMKGVRRWTRFVGSVNGVNHAGGIDHSTFGNVETNWQTNVDGLGDRNNQLIDIYAVLGFNAPVIQIAPLVIFINQTPSDIDNQNMFGRNLTVYYNITDDIELDETAIITNFIVNSSSEAKHSFINGSAVTGINKRNQSNNESEAFRFIYDDDDTYPFISNLLLETFFNSLPLIHQVTSTSRGVKYEFLNVSPSHNFTFVELMVNNTEGIGSLEFHYCNETYVSGNYETSSNCASFFSLEFDHPFNHSDPPFIKTHFVPLNIVNNTVDSVTVTSKSFIIADPSVTGTTWDIFYLENKSRTGALQTTVNNGISWSELDGTGVMLLHQFNGSEFFNYNVCANDTAGNENCSSFRSDAIGITNQPPNSPNILNPSVEIGLFNDDIIINYTPAISATSAINNYNISLLNVDGSNNITISSNNGLNLDFTWDSTAVSDANYTIKVTAIDINGLLAFDISDNFEIDNTDPILTVIEPLNDTTYTNDSVVFSFICSDVNLFGFDLIIFNSTDTLILNRTRNLTTTVFQQNTTIDLTTFPDRSYTASMSCLDGHTGNDIPDRIVKINPDSITIGDIKLRANSETTITYEKLFDRYNYEYSFISDKQHIITLTSPNIIYYRDQSPYKGHFISGNQWVDTEPYKPDDVLRISDYEYKIYLSGKTFNFNSIGDLNNVTQQNGFIVDRVVEIVLDWDGFDPPNASSFINKTAQGFSFNYSNSNASDAVCTLFRNDTNVSSGLFSTGIQTINDTLIPFGNFTSGFFLTCNSFDQSTLVNSSFKSIIFDNTQFPQTVDALKITQCPTTIAGILTLALLILIALIFIGLGIMFKVGFLGLFGSLMLMVSSWYVAPCLSIFAFIMAALSLVLIVWFPMKSIFGK